MTITRVKPGNWSLNEELFAADLNTLDQNATYGIDKRSGFSDTIGSDLTVNSNGSVTFFGENAYLEIKDPSDVTIPDDGYIACGATINNNSNFGFSEITLTSTSESLSADGYNNLNLRFVTLTNLGNITLTMPNSSGMVKVIDNQCSGSGFLIITAQGSSNSIRIQNGQSTVIYCDGTDIVLAANKQQNRVIRKEYVNYNREGVRVGSEIVSRSSVIPEKLLNYTASSVLQTNSIVKTANTYLTGTNSAGYHPTVEKQMLSFKLGIPESRIVSFTKIKTEVIFGGIFVFYYTVKYREFQSSIVNQLQGLTDIKHSCIFPNVQVGDFFDISFSAALSDSDGYSGSMQVEVGFGNFSTVGGINSYSNTKLLGETEIRYQGLFPGSAPYTSRDFRTTFYTAQTFSGQYEFFVSYKSLTGHEMTVLSPTNLIITQYRKV